MSVQTTCPSHYRMIALLVAVLLGLGLVFAVAWIAMGGLSYTRTLRNALYAYHQSRGADIEPNSLAFLSHGIRAGMSIQNVENAMSGCREIACFRGAEFLNEHPKEWMGPVKLYICEYGPRWYNPLFQRPETLVYERFWIFFDAQTERFLRCQQVWLQLGA